ncbi:hypothetical protein LSTR_LSTR004584 [Laodelphax striatellus]|uniref:Kelch-like protein diablo n=1 Tax=Laodelphax striatellus TaxID=195883 RepID=A0A482WUC1_LAOST|nr:hypothetical protein LSTR_LSTR004584 [Laodelphax striatellus]
MEINGECGDRGSCLLLRYASQNSLDESSQKHIPRPSSREKPPYRNHHHTHRAFDVMNNMRKINLIRKFYLCRRVGVLDGILYAVGGHDGPLVRKSVEAYNPEKKTWKPVSDMTLCRRNAGVVALNGLLYVVGGDDGSSNLASVEVYNPKTDSWSMLSSTMSIGRSYAGVTIIDKPSAL